MRWIHVEWWLKDHWTLVLVALYLLLTVFVPEFLPSAAPAVPDAL